MATIVFVSTFNPMLTDNGQVNALGWLNFFQPGSSSPKAVYSDPELSVSLSGSVQLDANGRATIYLSGDYDMQMLDEDLNQIVYVENINPDSGGQSSVNLVENGSFEINTAGDLIHPDSWVLTDYTGSDNDLDSDSATGSLAMHFVSTGDGGGNVISEEFFEVAGSDVLTATFWIKSDVAGVRNLVQIHWYDAGQSLLSSDSLYDEAAANPTDYTRQLVTVTAPTDARFAKVQFYGAHPSDATPGETWYDGVEIIPSSIGGAFQSGTKIVMGGSSAPSGWTFDTETLDRVLMFGDYTGGTEAGTWTISGLSGTHPHTHTQQGTFTSGNPLEAGIGDDNQTPATTSAVLHRHQTTISGQTGGVSSSPLTLVHTPGWRPAHRVVKMATKS